jgi:4-hydroxybenzoate polyprenyltransferase
VVFTALAQYVAAVYVFTPNRAWWNVLSELNLHLLVASSVFIIAAGFIINSFYDFEKDLINRPHKTLFNRVVSKEFCLTTYFVFNSIGLALAFAASWRVLLFFSAFSFWLWFYSHKVQKIPVLREIVASTLSVVAVFSVALYYKHFTWIMVIYGAIIMTTLFNREIIKDLKNITGDIAVGNESISTRWGEKTSKNLVGLVSVIMVGLLLVFYHFSLGDYTLYFTIGMSFMTLLAWGILTTSKRKKAMFWAHRIYKIMMAVSILYLIIY